MRGLLLVVLSAVLTAAEPEVAWAWSGAEPDAATVVARVAGDAPVRLVAAADASLATPVATTEPVAPVDGIVRLRVTGLPPAATLWYGLAVGAAAPQPVGRLRTLPAPGAPASFRIAFGSCMDDPASPVFAAIGHQDPLLFLITGDFTYADIAENAPDRIAAEYERNLRGAGFGALARALPVHYLWDDHDYGGNDSGRATPARPAVHAVYRRYVPHWPLAFPGEAEAIAQVAVIGRVRLVLTDLRSERTRDTLLGDRQRAWLGDQAVAAATAGQYLVWVSSVPWNGAPAPGRDRWQGYADERTAVADLLKASGVRVCILSGDAHMVAIDDGRNGDFATGGGMPIPVFQAAALARGGTYKAGPYSHGARPGREQFGLMEVRDDGRGLDILWSARDGSDGIGDRVVEAGRDAEGPIGLRFRVELPAH